MSHLTQTNHNNDSTTPDLHARANGKASHATCIPSAAHGPPLFAPPPHTSPASHSSNSCPPAEMCGWRVSRVGVWFGPRWLARPRASPGTPPRAACRASRIPADMGSDFRTRPLSSVAAAFGCRAERGEQAVAWCFHRTVVSLYIIGTAFGLLFLLHAACSTRPTSAAHAWSRTILTTTHMLQTSCELLRRSTPAHWPLSCHRSCRACHPTSGW